MAEDREPAALEISGALIGWERRSSRHGIIMTLQIVESGEQYEGQRYHRVAMALNDRQLRSLARDLVRAADRRGIDLRARLPFHRRIWLGLKGAMFR